MSPQPLFYELYSSMRVSEINVIYFAPAIAKKITHCYCQVLRTAKMRGETLEIAIFENQMTAGRSRFSQSTRRS
jgi:hypothetical protein